MKPTLPTFNILHLNPKDLSEFKELIQIFITEFNTEITELPSNKHLLNLLNKQHFHVFVAKTKDQILGGMTVYELIKYYSEKSEFYIYDIAVRKELQNLGIGKQLIAHLRELGNEIELDSVYVQADADETQAVRFYESTIGKGEKVEHFTINYNK